MLFKRKKAAPKEVQPSYIFSIPYTEHFKGYKRIKLDTFNDIDADKGLAAMKVADSVNQIIFKEYLFPGVSPLMRVYADNFKLGTIWSTSRPEQYELIKQGRCEKASVGYNDLGNVFLFVKFK